MKEQEDTDITARTFIPNICTEEEDDDDEFKICLRRIHNQGGNGG